MGVVATFGVGCIEGVWVEHQIDLTGPRQKPIYSSPIRVRGHFQGGRLGLLNEVECTKSSLSAPRSHFHELKTNAYRQDFINIKWQTILQSLDTSPNPTTQFLLLGVA
jgi:hypothetical protein